MDKNFIIAILLMLLVFLVWNHFLGPEPVTDAPVDSASVTEVPTTDTPGESNAGDTEKTPGVKTPLTPPGKTEAVANTPAEPLSITPTEDTPEATTTTFNTNIYRAILTSNGGAIQSFTLSKFMDKAGPGGVPVEMIWTKNKGFNFLTTEFVEFNSNNKLLEFEDAYKLVEQDSNTIVMARTCPSGLKVSKTYTFNKDKYLVDLLVTLENVGTKTIQGVMSLSGYSAADEVGTSFFKPPDDIINFQAYNDNGLEQDTTFKVRKTLLETPGNRAKVEGANNQFVGFSSKYFLLAMSPENPESTLHNALPRPELAIVESAISTFNQKLEPGDSRSFKYTCFLGPKTEKELIAAGHKFDMSRDFGWFSGIARFLVKILNIIYGVVDNYGIAIIVVTILIKIVLFPLTHKSYKSMKAMSKLQPEIKLLKEQYGNDKNTMNQKTMELYRKHKVNPASGCLPMLLQLPIFLAFYRALYSSIELRHAEFFLWIKDLSAPDPYYVTPILMGATMVITQKLTPSSADPMQQKMMMAMPIVFTFLFLSFPSGLVVYWLMSNVLSIAQQMYINKQKDNDEPDKPAGKLVAKKAKKSN